MKKNKKWILLASLALALIAIAAALIILLFPKTTDYTFPPFVDTYEESKSYTSQDSNIVFDGVLDDAAWNDQRWLEVSHVTDNATIISVVMAQPGKCCFKRHTLS